MYLQIKTCVEEEVKREKEGYRGRARARERERERDVCRGACWCGGREASVTITPRLRVGFRG